jgi:hypothetical protein
MKVLSNLHFAAILLLVGCSQVSSNTVENAPESSDQPQLNVWLAQHCPSTLAETTDRNALAGMIIAKAVDFFVDKTAKAISEAAKIDKEGQATVSISAAYLYRSVQYVEGKSDYALPRCAIVAISKSSPKTWCDFPAFKSSLQCRDDGAGGSLLSGQLTQINGVPELKGVGAPSFYAEIELHPSTDMLAGIPRLKSLYYPKAIHNSRKFSGDKKRDLSITLETTFPNGTSAAGAVHIQLRDIVPNSSLIVRTKNDSQKILDNTAQPIWITFSKAPDKLPSVPKDAYFGPVNVKAEVREVGDPNLFLQSIASYIDKNSEDISEKIKGKIIDGYNDKQLLTEEIELISNKAGLADAVAKVYAAQAALVQSCDGATVANPEAKRSDIRGKWELVKSSQFAVKKLELSLGEDPAFPEYFPDFEPGKSAYENCQSVRKNI